MIKRFKKGFTIVELVIVIAVIAVLAAVLIPTFSDIIEKANNSADLQEARNLFSEALIEDPTITDGTVYVQLVKKDEVKYVIFTDGAPVDNNKNGNYTDELDIPVEDLIKYKENATSEALSKIYKNKNEVTDGPGTGDPNQPGNDNPDPNHEHIRCATCGKCTVEDCNEEKCAGDHHTHLYCEICGKCEATGCNNTEKCTGNHQPSDATAHVFCEFCGNCTIESCTEHTKCNEDHAIVNVIGVALNKDSVQLVLGRDSVTLVATVFPANATNKTVTWNSSNEDVVKIADGVLTAMGIGEAIITVKTEDGNFTATCSINVICHHGNIVAFPIRVEGQTDSQNHMLLCNTCHEIRVDKEAHTIVDGKCSKNCGYEKTYTFVCSKHATHTYLGTVTTIKIKASNESCGAGHILPNHYDCPWGEENNNDSLADCTGCLTIDRSGCAEHDKSDPVNTGSSIGHLITCNTCNESWTEKHDNGKCECGYCAHSPKSGTYSDLGNGRHQYECQHCHKTQSESHTVNGSYESDAYKHIGTCKHCNASMTSSHSGTAGSKCSTCQYMFCGHPESEWDWSSDDEYHTLVCKAQASGCYGMKIIKKAEPHIGMDDGECDICHYTTNVDNCKHSKVTASGQQCSSCNAYIYYNDSGNQISNASSLSGTADKHCIIILNKDVTIGTALTLGARGFQGKITIDLNGHTFNYNYTSITLNCGSFELKNSKEEGKFVTKALISKTPLILNNVSVEYTGTGNGFITAGNNADIIIKDCNINVSNSTSKRIVYFNSTNIANASITITGSTITCTHLLYFKETTQGNISSNSITMDDKTTVNSSTITETNNIKNYLYNANGISFNGNTVN